MNRYLLEEFHSDPALRRRLFEAARRERARSVRAGLAWLRDHLTSGIRFRPSRWIARLG
jgi:hypothetical protein